VWAQLTYTVPVTEKGDSGKTLQISGTASFTERITGESVTLSSNFRVKARNSSDRGILLVVADYEQIGPHGGASHDVIEIDHFFWGNIGVGESFVLAEGRQSARIIPLSPAEEPRAEIRVRYVQFTDGSAFGDERAAKEALATRYAILESLRRLDNASGNEEFRKLLARRVLPEYADGFLENVRRTANYKGTRQARTQIRVALATAEARMPALQAIQLRAK
jgi:hypothetical protein